MNAIEKYNISENNCNGVLSRLYSTRDKISNQIDKLISMGYNTEYSESEYDKICSEISDICTWRSSHNCLLEGDPGFSYY